MSTWLTGTLGCQGLGTVCQLWCSGLGKGKMRRGGTMWRKRRITRSCWSKVVTARRGAPPSSDDSGDEVDDPPKRPAKKAKDSTPLNMFHAKVGQAKGKKAPPKKK